MIRYLRYEHVMTQVVSRTLGRRPPCSTRQACSTHQTLFIHLPVVIASIFKLTAAYAANPHPDKINLGVGAYRDNDGKPWVLPVVKKVCHNHAPSGSVDHCFGWQATQRLLDDPLYNHEYLPITGLPEFTSAAAKLILGSESPAIAEGRVASVQTVSGTGANHLAALFLSRYYNFNGLKQVFVSDPTWGKSAVTSVVVGGA